MRQDSHVDEVIVGDIFEMIDKKGLRKNSEIISILKPGLALVKFEDGEEK